MQSGEFKPLVQLDMEDLFTGQSLATFGPLQPTGDIIAKLRQWIDTDIETISNNCGTAKNQSYCVHDFEWNITKFICDLHHIEVF